MNFRDSQEKTLFDSARPLLGALHRYWFLAIGPALALAATSAFFAYKLPSYYSADSRILIQPQRISSKLLDEDKPEDMKTRLDGLAQEILSRPRLRNIIERFRVYPELAGISGGEKALLKMRQAIHITPADSATGGQASQTFQLSYTHSDPKMAHDVLTALSNLFIEESLVDRRSEAQGTEEFFDSQLAEARRKLEETENKKQEFISANFGKLPEHLEQAIARLQTLNSQLDTNAKLISANMLRRENLERELSDLRRLAPPTVAGQVSASDPRERLAQLESALVILRSRYSEEHPDVAKTRAQIDAIKAELGGSPRSAGTSNASGNPYVLNTRRAIDEVAVQLRTLKEESEQLKGSIDKLQGDIQEMPLKEQELLKINRDYNNVKASYEKLLAAREEAGLQSNLIKSQKGSQFRIVEPPEMPRIPAGPQRLLFVGAGIVAALALVILVPLGLFFLNGAFTQKEDIEAELGVKVLGVIPPMASIESKRITRRKGMLSFALSTLSAAIATGIIAAVI